MKHFKLILVAVLSLSASAQPWAQTSLKELSVQYNQQYSAENSYSIIHDNIEQSTKLKSFKIEFYGPGLEKLGETEIETYPINGTTEIYPLANPIEGFQTAKIIIYSLHNGDVRDLPIQANSILALNQLSEFSAIEPENGSDESSETTMSLTPVNLVVETENLKTEVTTLEAQIETLEDDKIELQAQKNSQAQILENQTLQIQDLEAELADLRSNLQVSAQSNPSQSNSSQLKITQPNQSGGIIKQTTGAGDVSGVGEGASNLWKIMTGLFGVLSLGLAGLLFLRFRAPSSSMTNFQNTALWPRPIKPLERPENAGTLFAASPMLAANVAGPLSTAGQLTASNLQMLKGQYAVLKSAYRATGRIGYAQDGVPNSEDYAFGTGFLVTPNHVATNRHVHGIYGEYLTGDDCGGIEFIAEKGKDLSDFYAFDGSAPVLIPGLDMAIYKLARPVRSRIPIRRNAIPTDDLEGCEIVVIGYPDTFDPDDPELLSLLEEDPVFAVKRISQGQIFRHSTDTDSPFGVETMVAEDDENEFAMPAISHNASTMTGNSGSPILDIQTGQLLGVHFAGYKIFNKQEAANLAMAITYILEQEKAHPIQNA